MDGKLGFLTELNQIIDQRLASGDDSSYVKRLLNEPIDRVLKKVMKKLAK